MGNKGNQKDISDLSITRTEILRRQKEYFQNARAKRQFLSYVECRDINFWEYAYHYPLIRLEPFVRTLSGKTVITICDGRGVEASYLRLHGLHVTATDIVSQPLAEMKDRGWFDNYSEENAEALSFGEGQFDWGMVKAGLHHLVRPLIGLYELLRVSREGVIVLEGNDGVVLRWLRRRLTQRRNYEPCGNYVYRFSRREIEKVCLALNLPGYAIGIWFMPVMRHQKKSPEERYSTKVLSLCITW